MSAKFELHHICSIRTLPPLPAWGRGATRTGGLHRFRLFRQRALRWQLLLVLVEFGLLVEITPDSLAIQAADGTPATRLPREEFIA